ncbi:MAG: hypothetical protein EOO00_14655 [Chitinophagaceae bacterium]|nr:MAG: hypothetical protein EOO00_14655 [Chitinophagaceae bacterium]
MQLYALKMLTAGILGNKWLAPFLNNQTKIEHLPWLQGLEFYLGFDNCQKIDELLPAKVKLPSGRDIIVEFSAWQ